MWGNIESESCMHEYVHEVKYYETDKMGITHHSNYIRWMEEARIDYLDKIGFSYLKMEETGIMSPVVSVNCDYKKTTTFGDTIKISVSIEEFRGVKLILSYTMINQNDELVCKAKSVHCFLDESGRPVKLKSKLPMFYEALISNVNV